ncbi:putative ribonuclease H protein, partial [Trifolium medium]|nr:putative ribonuclease H protein [Trifolium medium]
MEEDILCWQGTTNGHFTVKSGYHAIMEWDMANTHQAQASNYQMDEHTWNNLWKMVVPPKQTHLLWRILHNALLVKTNLISKGILCDSLCPRCNQEIETIDHTLLFCDWAKQVWNNKVFQNKDIPVCETVDRALKLLFEFQHNITVDHIVSSSANLPVDRNNKSWSPLPRNFLKLNVDAHLTDDGHWG